MCVCCWVFCECVACQGMSVVVCVCVVGGVWVFVFVCSVVFGGGHCLVVLLSTN